MGFQETKKIMTFFSIKGVVKTGWRDFFCARQVTKTQNMIKILLSLFITA